MINHSKQTIACADNIVYHYSRFDKLSDCYRLRMSDINDHDIHALSAMLMSDDHDYAAESTGPDNPNYDKSMLPALIRFMRNPTSSNQIEFNSIWQEGIAAYQEHTIEELLLDRLDTYNANCGYVAKHPGKNSWAA